jgi:hypothetical protein
LASRDEDLFDIYVRTYGKVQSGTKLETRDYGTQTMDGFVPFPTDGKTAVAMAAEDVKFKAPMRSMPDVLERLRSLTGNSAPTTSSPANGRPERSPSLTMIGDWRQIRPLRRGGQGDVVLVEREPPKEHAIGVLKRLPGNFADDPKRVARLKHEIETVRDLKHPFLAEFLDCNFNDLWFVTRYAALGSLADHLGWFKGDVWRTLRMARDVALALQVSHEKGVIHRDVKPGNILLYDPNHVALTDFGIAHDSDQTEVTSTTERVGASWFRPPEAEHGRHEPVPAFDVYMLGKVMYVALSGGERFRREAFQQGPANLVTMFARPELAVFNTLLAKMIVEEPSQRFQTMGDVIRGIDTALARLSGQRFVEAEHRLIFMFGDTGGQRYSGDHPGLQLVPVWMPPTTRLIVDLRIHPGVQDARFAIEFWSDETKVIDSGELQSGRHEVAVPSGTGGRWMSLRVRRDHGWGSANISNLVVHALCGDD